MRSVLTKGSQHQSQLWQGSVMEEGLSPSQEAH